MCDKGWKVVKSKSNVRKEKMANRLNRNREEVLRLQIKYGKEAYDEATKYFNENRGRIGEGKTGCLMFYVEGGVLKWEYGESGYPKGMKTKLMAQRSVTNVQWGKKTYCAEEIILSDKSKCWLFSCAFNRDDYLLACNGGKHPKEGKGGCRLLLDKYCIEDLNKY